MAAGNSRTRRTRWRGAGDNRRGGMGGGGGGGKGRGAGKTDHHLRHRRRAVITPNHRTLPVPISSSPEARTFSLSAKWWRARPQARVSGWVWGCGGGGGGKTWVPITGKEDRTRDATHSEHRFPAPSSKLCQIWLRH